MQLTGFPYCHLSGMLFWHPECTIITMLDIVRNVQCVCACVRLLLRCVLHVLSWPNSLKMQFILAFVLTHFLLIYLHLCLSVCLWLSGEQQKSGVLLIRASCFSSLTKIPCMHAQSARTDEHTKADAHWIKIP